MKGSAEKKVFYCWSEVNFWNEASACNQFDTAGYNVIPSMFGTARTQTNVIAQGPQVFVYMLNPKNNGKATSIQEIFSYPWQPPLPNNGQCPLYSLLQYPASQIFKHENTGKRRFKALNLPAGKGSVKVSVRLGCNLLQGVISSPGVSLRISFGTEFLLFAAVAKIRQASFQLRTCSEILSLT